MARSLSVSTNQPPGRVVHKPSATTVTIRQEGGQMIHRLESRGLSAEYPVAWTVGAGRIGFSYLVSLPPFIFQSPVSYYAQTTAWDVTPGYEQEKTLDFSHPILEGCMFCHSGTLNLVPGTSNRFREPAFTPISCDRCHGPSSAHLKNPVAGSIVNPAKLPVKARDSVCEQCHLEGETRILSSGKTWRDFSAGAELESVFTTFVRRADASEGVKAVSHSELLAESRCARESGGRLWCASCHDPHPGTESRQTKVRSVCLTCHPSALTVANHDRYDECSSCHMPRIRPSNVSHAAVTSHLIERPHNGAPKKESPGQTPSAVLAAWRQPASQFDQLRDLGLALFETGTARRDWDEVSRSYEILGKLPIRDGEVSATLGSILLGQKRFDVAVELYQNAAALEPQNARFAFVLGVALEKQGKTGLATAQLRKSIALDPSAREPYLELEQIYLKSGQRLLARQAVEDYLKVVPQDIEFRRRAD